MPSLWVACTGSSSFSGCAQRYSDGLRSRTMLTLSSSDATCRMEYSASQPPTSRTLIGIGTLPEFLHVVSPRVVRAWVQDVIGSRLALRPALIPHREHGPLTVSDHHHGRIDAGEDARDLLRCLWPRFERFPACAAPPLFHAAAPAGEIRPGSKPDNARGS